MNDLIKIEKVQGSDSVNARDLHEFLESKQDFSTWIKARIEKFAFEQNTDFIKFHNFVESASRSRIDYHLTIDMAKELGMLEGTERGREIRRWFIKRDKKLSQIESTTPAQLIDPNLASINFVADVLRVNEASRISMLQNCMKELGQHAAVKSLPNYTEEKLTKSLTALLAEEQAGMSAKAANKMLLEADILEEKTRPSTGKTIKKFKSLTEEGLKYGKNLISPTNQKQTQPHYFIDMFDELVDLYLTF